MLFCRSFFRRLSSDGHRLRSKGVQCTHKEIQKIDIVAYNVYIYFSIRFSATKFSITIKDEINTFG
jgi:hypothetical protein